MTDSMERIDPEALAAAKRRAEDALAEVQKRNPGKDLLAWYWLAFSPWEEVSASYCLYLIHEIECLREELDEQYRITDEVEHLQELDQSNRNEVMALLAEVERLRAENGLLSSANEEKRLELKQRRAENTASREIVQAVASIGHDATGASAEEESSPWVSKCPLCHRTITGPSEIRQKHADWCIVPKARALLAEEEK